MQKQAKDTIKLTYYVPGKHYRSGLNFVLPNMAVFVRDVTEHGNIGAIVRRALKLPISSLIKLAWWNKTNALKLLKKDFATGVGILIQMELLHIVRYSPAMVTLTDQLTDLSVALPNARIITSFLAMAQTLELPASLITNNLIATAKLLSDLGLRKVSLITPFNRFGYEMNPGQKDVEEAVRLMDTQYLYAIVPHHDSLEQKYLQRFGITKKVVGWF